MNKKTQVAEGNLKVKGFRANKTKQIFLFPFWKISISVTGKKSSAAKFAC